MVSHLQGGRPELRELAAIFDLGGAGESAWWPSLLWATVTPPTPHPAIASPELRQTERADDALHAHPLRLQPAEEGDRGVCQVGEAGRPGRITYMFICMYILVSIS